MGQQKGGKKLRRGPKHKGMYQAQVFRTARNKAARANRRERRKLENPSPAGEAFVAGHTKRRLEVEKKLA